jgi:hypothetical protein
MPYRDGCCYNHYFILALRITIYNKLFGNGSTDVGPVAGTSRVWVRQARPADRGPSEGGADAVRFGKDSVEQSGGSADSAGRTRQRSGHWPVAVKPGSFVRRM